MKNIQNILLPVDFSEGSKEAATYAIELCRSYHAVLRILHVVEMAPFVAYGAEWATSSMLKDVENISKEKLLKFVKDLQAQDIQISSHVETDAASVAEIICDDAKNQKIDLIVIPKHGRRGINRLLLGSVSEKVVRLAHCPVMTVPLSSSK